MSNTNQPYYGTPRREYPAYYDEAYASPSPTPSPGRQGAAYYFSPQQRPATRAHFRNMSSGMPEWSPRPPQSSPRYTSDGQYATFNVSSSRSSRKQSFSSPRSKRERRNSHSYFRPSDSHGESDEDEYFEVNGVTYVLPARSSSRRYKGDFYYSYGGGGHGTNHYYRAQTGQSTFIERDMGYATPRREPERREPEPRPEPRPTTTHRRRASTSMPQRPSTARPASSHKKSEKPQHRKATDADAKKHRIPQGYSLKNWDPAEEPITLLGSVFDANSLGKWIYDWTVYRHGPQTPIADMAGEMWLLLIQLFGKLKRSDEAAPKIRKQESREMIDDFIESGERLTDKLRKLLKLCESPMLKSSKKKDTQLGNNAGIEFVETLFGRERELDKTERYMQSVRLWNLRFDANCEEILREPHA